MVFGAGQDVEPLVSFGHSLGWSMQVVANNGGFGTRARFPRADVVHLGSPADAVATLKPDGDTVVLLMSHNFPLDVAALCALAPLQPRYIGLLGLVMLATGIFRFCPAYTLLGVNTCPMKKG